MGKSCAKLQDLSKACKCWVVSSSGSASLGAQRSVHGVFPALSSALQGCIHCPGDLGIPGESQAVLCWGIPGCVMLTCASALGCSELLSSGSSQVAAAAAVHFAFSRAGSCHWGEVGFFPHLFVFLTRKSSASRAAGNHPFCSTFSSPYIFLIAPFFEELKCCAQLKFHLMNCVFFLIKIIML